MIGRASPLVLALGAFASCQTYDFEPVAPLAVAQTTQSRTIIARQKKPNMMILLDKSGSMALPINPADANCPVGCGSGSNLCPANCPTRISELRNAMDTFLTQNGTVARLGLTTFPSDSSCGASGAVRHEIPQSEDVASELQARADEVKASVLSLRHSGAGGYSENEVIGGTPTSFSLDFLGGYAPLQNPERADFVLLLTDGLPNCNPDNPNKCVDAASCRCTLGGGGCGTDTSAPYCTKGCLDQTGVVTSVSGLRSKEVRTIVVGFGADTGAGDGPIVLNAMAEAGGFARACPNGTNAECGTSNSCDPSTKLCGKKFYQASDGAELSAALKDIGDLLKNQNICEFVLEATPTDARFISVLVDGQALTRDDATTWTYSSVGGDKVILLGKYCDALKASTVQTPVKVEIRVVETL